MRGIRYLSAALLAVALASVAVADPSPFVAPGLPAGETASDASSLMTRDLVSGVGNPGPYYLRFKDISPVGVIVRMGPQRMARDQYQVNPGEGAVTFTDPLPTGTQVTVEYFRLPLRSLPNIRSSNVASEATIGSFFAGDLSALFHMTTDPNNPNANFLQSGLKLSHSGGDFGFDAAVMFSQATDPRAPFQSDLQRLALQSSGQQHTDASAVKLNASGNLGFAAIKANYTALGLGFAGAQQSGFDLKPGENRMQFELAPNLQGPLSLKAAFTDWSKPSAGQSKRTMTYDFGLALAGLPHLTMRRTSLTDTQGDHSTNTETDLMQVDYQIAGVTVQALQETTQVTAPDGQTHEQVKDHMHLQTALGKMNIQAVTEAIRQGEDAGQRTTTVNLTMPVSKALALTATSFALDGNTDSRSRMQLDLGWKAGKLGTLTSTWMTGDKNGVAQQMVGLALTVEPLKGLSLTGRIQQRIGDGLMQTTEAGTQALETVGVQEVGGEWKPIKGVQVKFAQFQNPLDKKDCPQLGDGSYSLLTWQASKQMRFTLEQYDNPLDKERRLQAGAGERQRIEWALGKRSTLSLEHVVNPLDDNRRIQPYSADTIRLTLPLGKYDLTTGFSERVELPTQRNILTGELRVDGPFGKHAHGYIGAEFGLLGTADRRDGFDYLLRFGLTSQIDARDWYLDLSGIWRTTEGSDVLFSQPKTRYSLTANYRW